MSTTKTYKPTLLEKKSLKRARKNLLKGENKYYHPRDIWWCNLGVNIGYEQDGTGKEKERPVVIIKGFSKSVCLVIPLTTSKKSNKYYIKVGSVDNKEASAIISQVRLIDTKRLANKIDVLDRSVFEEIRKAIRNFI
ncbi:MAG: type II toxin-antitoxin system PemK/MazF family toxin [Candidatus Paceibacteria bacterium]